MEKNHYTIRSLAARIGKTHAAAASLMRRMVKDGLAEFVSAQPINPQNTKTKVYVYALAMDPERYISGVRSAKVKPPKSGFFNNPFNMRGAVDARYNP